MNRRVCTAVVGSVLLHLVLVGGLSRWERAAPEPHAALSTEAVNPPVVAIQVRVLQPGHTAEARPEKAPLPKPRAVRSHSGPKVSSAPGSSLAARFEPQPAAESAPSAPAVPHTAAHASEGAPMQRAIPTPLVLSLPTKGTYSVADTSPFLPSVGPDRRRAGEAMGGGVVIQETQSLSGERRATVTTPWGRYCMRERRSAGSPDLRRDRGMEAVTCP